MKVPRFNLKNGADKRRVTSQNELKKLFQSTGDLYADELTVNGTSINDIDMDVLNLLVKNKIEETIVELVVNALVHRNYFIQADIKIFIFDDRIEIINPGNLPNTLTIDNIKIGASIPQNPILYVNAPFILPFVGIGSGIPRALRRAPNMELINDKDRELFIARIFRPKAYDEL